MVTMLLEAASAGEAGAATRLMALVYDHLRSIARERLAGERPGHTLQATALVNEAYVRLLGKPGATFEGRGHFFRAAAQAMRRILIDHARARNADKRGGGKAALRISGIADVAVLSESEGIMSLDDAILRLEKVDERAAAVVRLRFYAGLPDEWIAETLSLSVRSVRRDWAFARAWLREDLERGQE
jgi:RNA polymerase sigma factor (TIGR02999 family)